MCIRDSIYTIASLFLITGIVAVSYTHLDVYKRQKEFFSEAMKNDQGEDVSTLEIKKILQNTIEEEDKSKPLPDDQLAEILKEKGYPIARRTIAKYREQLDICLLYTSRCV